MMIYKYVVTRFSHFQRIRPKMYFVHTYYSQLLARGRNIPILFCDRIPIIYLLNFNCLK